MLVHCARCKFRAAGQIRRLRPGLMLPQYRNDLFFRKPPLLHRLSPLLGQTLIRFGGNLQWQVSENGGPSPQACELVYAQA